MLGAYLAWQVVQWLHPGRGILAGGARRGVRASALLGAVVERLFFRYLYGREELYQLLFTYALVLILGDAAKFIWGTGQLSVSRPAGARRRRADLRHDRPLQPVHHRGRPGDRAWRLAGVEPHRRSAGMVRAAAHRPRDARRARRQCRLALHWHVHVQLVPRRALRRAGDADPKHRAGDGRADHRPGLHRRRDRRDGLVLGHVLGIGASTARCCRSAS